MDDWTAVEGEILASSVETWRYNEFSQLSYKPAIRYRYQTGGEEYTSERIRRVPIRSAAPDKAEKWTERFPAGISATVYFDPADPSASVLKRDSKAALYSIWFPLLFVVGGAGMVVGATRKLDKR